MVFLLSNSNKGSVALGSETDATNKGELPGDASTGGISDTASIWSVMQDRLRQEDRKLKDAARSFFLLNEELRRADEGSVARGTNANAKNKGSRGTNEDTRSTAASGDIADATKEGSGELALWSAFRDRLRQEDRKTKDAAANSALSPDETSGNKSDATKRGGLVTSKKTQLATSDNTADANTDESSGAASLWSALRDRLQEEDRKMKDAAKSVFEMQRVGSGKNSPPSGANRATIAVGNKTSANEKGGPNTGQKTQLPATTTSAANTSENNDVASMWRVFRDRLLQKDRKAKGAAESGFFLNEELQRVESRVTSLSARRSSSLRSGISDVEDELLSLFSCDARQELERQEYSLPDRWLDFFCIVGLEPGATLVDENEEPQNKPVLLDRYPKEDRADVDFPEHLPTFCFPDGGCRPLRCRVRRQESQSSSLGTNAQNSSKAKEKKNDKMQHHHNAPDPFLHSMVLTSSSGHHLYCTTLTVYEMREEKTLTEEKAQEARKQEYKEPAKGPEEPTAKSMSKNNDRKRDTVTTASKANDTHYWTVPKCVVLISHYPFFQAQSNVLKALFYTVQSGVSPLPFERYVAHLLEDVPLPRSSVGGQSKRQCHTVVEWVSWIRPVQEAPKNYPPPTRLEQPPPNRLPLMNVSIEPLFRTLSLSNVLVIWANLLQEGKIILACSSHKTTALLVPIAEALLALLFPLKWQGLYIPLLPNNGSVLDVLQAPVPYLIGLARKQTDELTYNPQNHPSGVLWCDLDNDILHLGFKVDIFNHNDNNNAEEIISLPALPSEASMTLKAELEEIADVLYLPTVEGIKGRITVGDRTIELDNALRQPYAPRTKLFTTPMATPRKYILTQCCTIPSQEKVLEYHDFCFVPNENAEEKATTTEDRTNICSLALQDIQNMCDENAVCTNMLPIRQKGKEEDSTTKPEKRGTDKESGYEEKPTADAMNQDSTFLSSLKKQNRFVQAHIDHALAVLGQDYATPSKYATRSSQQFRDVLRQQDQIAANFFFTDSQEENKISKRVRESFLRFFLAVFARYKFFLDPETDDLYEERFVASLNLPHRQRQYVKTVVTSQMFDGFLHDTHSIKHRKLFDEYIIKRPKSHLRCNVNEASNNCYRTPLLDSSEWQNPTIIIPEKPCCIGLKEGRIYCHNRRFPDNLDPDECITNQSVSLWKKFWEGEFCSAVSSCT